jgi:hypothetical protein
MSTAARDLSGQVHRVLFEALGAFASEEVVLEVLASALASARLDGPPVSPAEVRRFVSDELLPVVRERLGDDAALGVREQLEPLLDNWELSDSQVRAALAVERRDSGIPREESPTRALRPGVSRILVATEDDHVCAQLSTLIAAAVEVVPVVDSLTMFERLDEAGSLARLLVIDCASSPVDLVTLMRSASLLPEHTQVILWRAGPTVSLSALPEQCASRWSAVRPPTTTADLASMCAWLIAG